MECPNCGQKILDTSKYCPECGQPVENIQVAQIQRPTIVNGVPSILNESDAPQTAPGTYFTPPGIPDAESRTSASKKKKLKGWKLALLIVCGVVLFLFLVFILTPMDTDDTSSQTTDTVAFQSELAVSIEEAVKSCTSGTFQGPLFSCDVDESNGISVLIVLDADDGRFSEPVWCAQIGASVYESINKYHPEIIEAADNWNISFAANDRVLFEMSYTKATPPSSPYHVVNLSDQSTISISQTDIDNAVAKRDKAYSERESQSAAQAESRFRSQYKTLDYNELSRNPNSHSGEKVMFTGRVSQVVESTFSKTTTYLVYTKKDDDLDEYYEEPIYLIYSLPEDESRILEDDIIIVYGAFNGLQSYRTILGDKKTIPSVTAERVDIK